MRNDSFIAIKLERYVEFGFEFILLLIEVFCDPLGVPLPRHKHYVRSFIMVHNHITTSSLDRSYCIEMRAIYITDHNCTHEGSQRNSSVIYTIRFPIRLRRTLACVNLSQHWT